MTHLLTAVSAILLAAAPPGAFERKTHDDTIYIVRGSADQLAKFEKDVGSRWAGGKLLTKDDEHGAYRYWAFPDRSAPQAREFMFGAMGSGLLFDIIAYDERLPFRTERSALDEIAISCGLTHDPFFITPVRQLEISFETSEGADKVRCAKKKLKTSSLRNMIKAPVK